MGSLDSRLDAPFLFSWRGHYLQPDKFLDREGVINAAKKKGYRISDKPIDAVRSLRLDIEIAEQLKEQKARLKRAAKATPLVMSGVTHQGVTEALRALVKIIDGAREEAEAPREAAWGP